MKQGKLIVVIVALVGMLSMLLYSYENGDASLTRARAEGLTIGYAIEPPFAFQREDGTVTGEAPELAKLIASRLGITHVEWRQYEFDVLIPELERGAIDVIAAGMFVTPERSQRVRFSHPTAQVRQGLLVSAGNPRGLHAYSDIAADARLRVAVIAGSVEERYFAKLHLAASQLLVTPDARTGKVAVESGRADALALSAPSVQWMALNNKLGQLEIAAPFAQTISEDDDGLGHAAFAFRLDDKSLLKAWNATLLTLLGSDEHLALVEPFGFGVKDLPPPAAPDGDSP